MVIYSEQRLYTTAEAAQKLGISVQRVRALARANDLHAVNGGGRALLITEDSLLSVQPNRGHRGRLFTSDGAMAALWMLSGEHTDGLTAKRRYAIGKVLRECDVDALVRLTRKRAEVRRYWASPSIAQRLKADADIHLSAACGPNADYFGLVSPDRVEAYADVGRLASLEQRYMLSHDDAAMSDSNVVLHVVRDCRRIGAMPIAVCAVDLAQSDDFRERSAGRNCLRELLDKFKGGEL
ncbi:helix-turn-helix domain-containing protein [Bifidobacterium avesanii]|uniref:Helix-turn-helix domain-containing protein n=1 Tax=Bifidobacterium avesanii TaxID=1798157 RepID=A0A7K3THR8_9BIFI|nr:helix-turn-helix domain-containing protein [Bifidobacterium avesanii]KAB8291999.1 DNA-binding domain, excisionase family [Bifidobacterium avesanii]NEG78638.1 helix-turn-helix domain-containing protein [Bifidobacterium avesanii]